MGRRKGSKTDGQGRDPSDMKGDCSVGDSKCSGTAYLGKSAQT